MAADRMVEIATLNQNAQDMIQTVKWNTGTKHNEDEENLNEIKREADGIIIYIIIVKNILIL